MNQSICPSLSHSHDWYEVAILEVSAFRPVPERNLIQEVKDTSMECVGSARSLRYVAEEGASCCAIPPICLCVFCLSPDGCTYVHFSLLCPGWVVCEGSGDR